MDSNTTSSPDLLQDIEQDYQYEDASTGLRFANHIIDSIAFLIVFVGTVILWTIAIDRGLFYWITELPFPIDRLFGLVVYGLVMAIVEGFSKGRSVGKLVTGTVAVRWDNQPFGWGDAFGRGFSRMVPFEPFSALWGSPWHDKWTDTRVVKMKK